MEKRVGPLVTVNFGIATVLGLRLDLDKGVFIDRLADPRLDRLLQDSVPALTAYLLGEVDVT